MNFDFTDDQRMLRDQARRFLEENANPREIMEGDQPFDRGLWKKIASLAGWARHLRRKTAASASHIDLCVIAEELGRALAPVPFASSIYLAREAIGLPARQIKSRAHCRPVRRLENRLPGHGGGQRAR